MKFVVHSCCIHLKTMGGAAELWLDAVFKILLSTYNYFIARTLH